MAHFIEKTCAQCNITYKTLFKFRNRAKYCSRACKIEAWKKPFGGKKQFICERCQKPFWEMAANRKQKRVFCSRRCYAWKGGVSLVYKKYGPAAIFHKNKKLTKLIYERDNYKCTSCGAIEDLCRHHIDQNPKNNDLSNFLTLCNPCHTKLHHSKY